MKYISKRFQKYLDEENKTAYNKLKSKRRKQVDKFRSTVRSRDKADCQGIDKSLQKITQNIQKIDKEISDIEFISFENAEKDICVTGNIISHVYKEEFKMIVSGKKNRDFYLCNSLENISSERSLHWKTIVKYYQTDAISM